MRRREFMLGLALATLYSLPARAQQPGRVWRIGVIMGLGPRDRETVFRTEAFESSWQQLGWAVGRNIHVDYHWAFGDAASVRFHVAALVAAGPDVILAAGTSILAAVRQANQSRSYLSVFPILSAQGLLRA